MKKNKILILIIFIIIIICSIFGYKYFKQNIIKNKLEKDGFEEITEKIYLKRTTIDNNEVGYTYNLNNNNFSKAIENKDDNTREIISITKDNNVIKIIYSYKDSLCTIDQEGSYINNNFKCEIANRTNHCETKCDVMLKYINEFQKEAKKY